MSGRDVGVGALEEGAPGVLIARGGHAVRMCRSTQAKLICMIVVNQLKKQQLRVVVQYGGD